MKNAIRSSPPSPAPSAVSTSLRLHRSLSEVLVLGSRSGAIAAISSTRELILKTIRNLAVAFYHTLLILGVLFGYGIYRGQNIRARSKQPKFTRFSATRRYASSIPFIGLFLIF